MTKGKFAITGTNILESNCLANQMHKALRRINLIRFSLKTNLQKTKSIKVKSNKWTLDPPHFDWWHQHSRAEKKKNLVPITGWATRIGLYLLVSHLLATLPSGIHYKHLWNRDPTILSTRWECDHPQLIMKPPIRSYHTMINFIWKFMVYGLIYKYTVHISV